MKFKNYFEHEWKIDMGMPNQLDNPTLDKAFNNEDSTSNPKDFSNQKAVDNIHSLQNHIKSLSRLVVRIVHSDKFFGLEEELKDTFMEFKANIEELINKASDQKIQQPQIGQDTQGIPLNQQTSPEMLEKLRGDQPPNNNDPQIGRW